MAKNNDVNPNIIQVSIIEGLVSQITGHLEALMPKTATQNDHKQEITAEIAKLQEVGLYKLRKAFE